MVFSEGSWRPTVFSPSQLAKLWALFPISQMTVAQKAVRVGIVSRALAGTITGFDLESSLFALNRGHLSKTRPIDVQESEEYFMSH